jgi:YHS domain-containing protein
MFTCPHPRPAAPRRFPWFARLAAGAVLVLSGFAVATPAEAQVINRNGTRWAIGGYDPVAYVTEGRAVRGDEAHQHRWGGATWLFSSAEHKDRFAANPGRWAPKYGGYCAYAMAQGQTVRIDPDVFTVHQGRLYLNYDAATGRRWNGDRARYIREADERWPEVRKRLRGD